MQKSSLARDCWGEEEKGNVSVETIQFGAETAGGNSATKHHERFGGNEILKGRATLQE